MPFYRRQLPHLFHGDQPVFLTWRLQDSLPPDRAFPENALTSGKAFVMLDRLLDQARTGLRHLSQPSIAEMVVEAIGYNASVLGHYDTHAFVVMANHVHLLVIPRVPLPRLTRSLKGITAKRVNALLGFTGQTFWQEESYDRLVRDEREFERIRYYIEQNPVRAGLVKEASDFRWSSAWPAGGPAADQGVRPTR